MTSPAVRNPSQVRRCLALMPAILLLLACTEPQSDLVSPSFAKPGKPPPGVPGVEEAVLDIFRARGIDESGRVVGYALEKPKGSRTGIQRPAIWTPAAPRGMSGTSTRLSTVSGRAIGISDGGQVVVWAMDKVAPGDRRPVIWDANGVYDLPQPPPHGTTFSFPNGISNPDPDGTQLVVGGKGPGAVAWTFRGTGAGFEALGVDLLPDGEAVAAFAANSLRQVIGGGRRLWTHDGAGWSVGFLPLPAGASGGEASGMNAGGTIVGSAGTGSCGGAPVVWAPGSGTPELLPDLRGGTCGGAGAINDAGYILGAADYSTSGGQVARGVVLWVPVSGGYAGRLVSTHGAGHTLNEPAAEADGHTYLQIVGNTTDDRAVIWKVRLTS